MADISKINVNSTTYNIKDGRLPSFNNSTTQYLRGDGTWATPTVSEITSSADVSDDSTGMIIEPGGGGGTYQAKTNITPTTSSQTITPDSGYDALSSVQINAMPSGSASTPATTITANPSISVSSGGLITATVSGSQSVTPTVSAGYVSSGVAGTVSVSGSNTSQLATFPTTVIEPDTADYVIPSGRYLTGEVRVKAIGKNVQTYNGYASRKATTYGATSVTLTVGKTGTYNVSWCAARGSSSGTMGTQLYVNSTAGTQNQTWTGTYWQHIELSNQSYTKDDVLTLYAVSGNTSRTVYVGNLVIEEV